MSHEPRGGRRLRLVVATGALLTALGVGWFGGSYLYRLVDSRDETGSVATARRKPAAPIDAPAPTAPATTLSGDLAAVKQAIDLVREGKTGEATTIA